VVGTAEQLPFPPARFDNALVVTTLCFVDSPVRMRAEAHRVLAPNGPLTIGFIGRDSPLGRDYLAHQAESVFYREATFHSAGEVEQWLSEAGFTIRACGQTLSCSLAETREIEPLQPGRGRCSFVVVSARKGP
jgi:SAM-dependent methyltransferase